MDADRSGAHYGTEEGDLACHGVENVPLGGNHGGSLLVLESEGYADGKVRTSDFGRCNYGERVGAHHHFGFRRVMGPTVAYPSHTLSLALQLPT